MYFVNSEDFFGKDLLRVVNTNYDAVIAGAGTAGLVAALTLIERGCNVVILDAGPMPFYTHLMNTELRFNAPMARNMRLRHQYFQKLPNGDKFGPNLSCVGGRGLFWNGAAPRFRPHDFENWPFAYHHIEPYYTWIEDQFRVNTSLGETPLAHHIIGQLNNSLNSLKRRALPAPFAFNDTKIHNAMLPAGVASGLALFTRNTSDESRRQAFDLLAHTFVEQISFDGARAKGVKARTVGGKRLTIHARNVIVANGGIESARLIANSNIPDPTHRIGIGIQEHLFYRTFWNAPEIYGAQRDSAAIFIPSTSQVTEQLEIHAPGDFLFATDSEAPWIPQPNGRFEVMVRSFAATRKTDENRVEFHQTALGDATVSFNHAEFEARLKVQMKDTVVAVGSALHMNLVRDGFAAVGGSYHEAGGLDMGADPKTSVTDPNGRIHTMDNVYVVDASTFPAIGATNPHLTIGAIARKQAVNLNLL